MNSRTPLAKVRGLGSAKEGTDHFWRQRVTAVSNLILVCVLIALLFRLIGADYQTVRHTLARPQNAILLLLLVFSEVTHMRIGMQGIIEDYVHSDGAKVIALILNSFFAIAVGLTCAFALLKLSLGA